jgi:hypothetical protein
MAIIVFNDLKKELLDLVETELKDAKTDIENYINSKKDDIESWPKAVSDGTLTPDLVKSLMKSEEAVIESILLAHILKLKLASGEKARELAVKIAEKLIGIIFKAII